MIRICFHFTLTFKTFKLHRIVGLFEFSNPFYLIRDPALAKELCVRQFEFFTDNKTVVDEKIDPLMGNTLMSLKGERWKEMRSILSAAFTGSKMRTMFNLVNKSVESAIITIDRDVAGLK
jgi:cytochrome P450 family 9